MQTLVAEGLLRKANHRGCFVAKVEPGELCEIYQAREAIEGMAARLMAEQANQDEVAVLWDIHREWLAAKSEQLLPRFTALGTRFHRQIIRGCGNRYIAHYLNTDALLLKAIVNFHFVITSELREGEPSHADIIAAIEAHDADRAERMAREHIRETRKAVQQWAQQAAGSAAGHS